MSEHEHRCFRVPELRVAGRRGRTIVGHAAVFGSLSEPLPFGREEIQRGAFAEAIGRDDVRALWNHDANHVLGRTSAGTLRLAEDARGLAVEIDVPETTVGNDALVSIARGDVDQMSFGFTVPPDGDRWEERNGEPVRTILAVELFDVSPVTFPAYQSTDAAVRSRQRWLRRHPCLADRLRWLTLSEIE